TVGDLSGSGQVQNNGNDLTVNQTSDQEFSGNITGAGGLTKQGESNLTLGGDNDFTGVANINEGELTVSGDLATNTINVANGATLTTTAANLLSDGATVTADGTLNLGGNQTLSNLLGSDTGVVNIGASNLLLTGGVDFQGRINGEGGSVSAGPGDLILGGDNTFTGDLVILDGSTTTLAGSVDGNVDINAGGELSLGSAERIADGASLNVDGTLNTNGEETVNSLNATGTINGEGTVSALTTDLADATVNANLGDGDLTSDGQTNLSGNAAAGTVTVAGGTLTVDGALTNNTATVNVVDGTLAANGTIAASSINVQDGATLTTGEAERLNDGVALNTDGTVSLGGNETIGDLSGIGQVQNNGNELTVNQTSNQNFSGNITGAGGLTKQGEAELTLANGSNFTGAANINEGELTVSGDLATNTINVANGATLTTTAADLLSDGATLTNNGTLNLGGNDTITNLFGSETGAINLAGNDLLVLGGVDFQGRINGEGGTVSTGPGDIILGGDNTFTGELTILSGSTTTLTGSADGDVTIAAGGELTLGSFERIADTSILTIITGDGANPSGILNLNGTERVTTLQSGGIIRGPGLVNAETYNLTDGAITEEGADLGNGILNSDGTVLLGGDSFAGTVNVQSGTMTLNGSMIHEPALTVNVNQGATLALGFDERIGDNAVANINGTLTLNGTETVTTFNLSGPGSTLNGTGLVLAETYNLANGATTEEGADLGSGILNSDGDAEVTLNGDSAAGDVNINSGTFNLNGQLTDVTDLTISGGATVNLGSEERINDPAVVSVLPNGTLNLNGTETIRSYNSNGTLGLSPDAIAGTLVVTESPINLMDGHVSLNGTNLENLVGEDPQLTSNGNVLIRGTAGNTDQGPGNATINVDTLDIQSGTLTLNGLLTNPDGTIDIRTGATLISGSSNRINGDSSTLNMENGGTWTLGGDDTIGTFNSSGLLNGGGILTATTYNLSNGAITATGANLGTGTLNSGPGTVTLNGDAAAETASINSGTLNLNGQLTGVTDLNIANGGTLVSGSADRVNDSAVANITTGGTWTLDGDDAITTFNSGGLLNGNGTLTALTYNLTDGAVTGALADLGSGTLNSDGNVTLNGDSAAEIANVNSGTLNLNGQLPAVTDLNIASGGTLLSGSPDRINDSAITNITTGGTWTLNGGEAITTFNSGGLLNGNGTLTAETYNLTDGAVTETQANLGSGTLNSDGNVTLNGDAAAETANVNSGFLSLNGQLTGVTDLNIANGATLANGSAERINDAAVVENSGALTLNGEENITAYNSDGGLLDGAGLLTAGVYNLSNGAETVAGANLGTGTLNSGPGTVTLGGNTNADAINISSGALITNGAVQNPAGLITVASDSTWNVNGTYTYRTLQGEGTVDPGGANGNTFRNENTINPGNNIGTLTIAGDYIENGIYHAQLDESPASDTLRITGSTTLETGSSLELAEFGGLINGSGAVLCGERWNIIETPGVINGGWGEISDINNPGSLGQTFQTQLLFDRGTGDLVSLGLLGGQTVADYVNISTDQATILTAVLDGATGNDLITGNFNSQDGGAGTLLNAIYTAGQPGEKTALYDAINSLSPEAFAGAVDYALLSTRGYAENALRYRPRMQDGVVIISDGKNGGAPMIRDNTVLETFAGYSHLDVGSTSSSSGNDYHLKSNGIYGGGRWQPDDDLAVASFIAGDVGSVGTSSLELDVHGLILGASFDYAPLGIDSPLRILGTATYGNYEFEGQRRSVAGQYRIPEFDANAFEFGLRTEYDLLAEDGLRVTPALGLRHISATTDGFTETGGPGALRVEEQKQNSTLLDLGIFASYQKFGEPVGFHAELRWQHDFAEAHRDIDAAFAASATPFQVTAPGVGSDALVFSIGSYYDFNERYRVGLTYRGERRSGADMLHSLNLRFMAGF
ncbi:MAG: autotransporter-associated beta strand repeat-containing protein, partial [Verrucomicrobiota bacterium]|nr:autotransporter-associated beta strand repeat-containing protein [Verrucomicrobiota bacterium]